VTLVSEVAAALAAEFPDWLIRPEEAPDGVEGNLFENNLPDTPDLAVGLYEYGGAAPRQTLGNQNPTENPRIQVLVRHFNVEEALGRSKQIMRFLITINDQELSGVRYIKISAASGPGGLGSDSENRHRFSTNFQVEKEWSPDEPV
jgi:hypothetical protein